MMRPSIPLALSLAAVLATASACSDEVPPEAPVIRPVRYAVVARSGDDQTRTFAGIARATAETNLSFRVPGRVQQLDVVVGQAVPEGSPIAELDPRDLQLQVQEARASLASARAEAERADAENERARKLYENDNASKSEYDRARAAAGSARAAVEVAAKRLELADRQLGYTRLRAPVDGRIASVSVEANENVSAGQPVVMLASDGTPEVEVAIPESVIMAIREGAAVSVQLDAIPNERFAATVTEVGVATGETATTFPVTVRLREASTSIRSGMAASVEFHLSTDDTSESIRVAPVAVGEDRDGRFVFTLEPTGDELAVARRRAVRVGTLGSGGLEIAGGLEDGELIATVGVRRLVDGQTVRLLPENRE